MQDEIEAAAYAVCPRRGTRRQDRGGRQSIRGHRDSEVGRLPIDERQRHAQVERVRLLKATRDNDAVRAALEDLATAARGSANVLYPMKVALSRRATLGEVADVLRGEFGLYQAS